MRGVVRTRIAVVVRPATPRTTAIDVRPVAAAIAVVVRRAVHADRCSERKKNTAG
jgi:hypothetical protein